jgi:hypothetical protein
MVMMSWQLLDQGPQDCWFRTAFCSQQATASLECNHYVVHYQITAVVLGFRQHFALERYVWTK